MQKFVSKSVIVEAVQFTQTSKDRVYNFITLVNKVPVRDESGKPALDIQTPDGEMRVHFGDYVIKNDRGEFYPCKAKYFESLYVSVE